MRWRAKAAFACAILACATIVSAGVGDKPQFKKVTEAKRAESRLATSDSLIASASMKAEGTQSGPVNASGERIEVSPDGASIYVIHGHAAKEQAALAEQAGGRPAFTQRGEDDEGEEGEDGEGGDGGCGTPGAGSCCEPHGTPGCEDAECCEFVCYNMGMPWCCEEGWDEECAMAAADVCEGACGPEMAACCFGEYCIDLDQLTCEVQGGRWFNRQDCGTWSCPACPSGDSLYSQDVTGWSNFFAGTSDLDYDSGIFYERFTDVQGDICGVKWVGSFATEYNADCYENPATFVIRFLEDDAGMPGAEACSYTVTVTGVPVTSDISLGWYEYTAEFAECCTLQDGWISIASTGGDLECYFRWLEGVGGDSAHCTRVGDDFEGYWNCVEPGSYFGFDFNFCLLGTPYPGACCDEVAGTCIFSEAVDCPATSRFMPGVACEAMDPPCGALAGACCIGEAPYCYIESEANCEGTYLGHGTFCDANDCNANGVPDTCDIASGNSDDCDGNGLPDDCDIAGGADDYDANGVLDACEPDCNGNGVVDACDINCATGNCQFHPNGCGVSQDCQGNGIPDECELGTLGSDVLWDNGAPNNATFMRSHFGGYLPDILTVDDIMLSAGGRIDGLHWEVEETNGFDYQGFVRCFIFADNGNGGPDDANQIASFIVPGNGATLLKTSLGDGVFLDKRYRCDVYGLNIELPAGTYWIGMAVDGGVFDYDEGKTSRWCAARSGGFIVGGEAHLRAPGFGITLFVPWSQQSSTGPHDMAFSVTTSVHGADCNSNGIPDDCDIADCDGSPWCQDCQDNGIPDGCEPDCNGNGIADQCDIIDCDGSGWCGDCDGNEVPDGCQVPPLGSETDCNANGTPDDCEVAHGLTPDCNENGIPDSCDIAGGFSDDYDLNGIPDECDPDCNGNGVVDACDVNCSTGNCGSHPLGCNVSLDCQGDGIPDECQLTIDVPYQHDDGRSDDQVGINAAGDIAWLNQFVVVDGRDTVKAISLAWGEMTAGTPCTVYLWSDPNNDGNPSDAVVLTSASTTVTSPDTDTFVTIDIPDTYVGPTGTYFFAGAICSVPQGEFAAPLDDDASGTFGWVAIDVPGPLDPNDLAAAVMPVQRYAPAWLVRAVSSIGVDCNNNSIPDECDISSGFSADCDGNGLPDECEWIDCNANGIHDPCDLLTCDGSIWCSDCNYNGIIDECDLLSGFSQDCQSDNIPDDCQCGGTRVVLEETFEQGRMPEGWETVTIAGTAEDQWFVAFSWGCDDENGAVFWGSMGHPDDGDEEEEEEKAGNRSGPIDAYLLMPVFSYSLASLSICTAGCADGVADWCGQMELDLVIVVGDIGGGDDINVGSISDLWVGYFEEYVTAEFNLNEFLPNGPYRIAFRYHGAGGDFNDVLIDHVTLSVSNPGSDCNKNGIPDECDLNDCDGSSWCSDCNQDGILDGCQAGYPSGAIYHHDDGSSEAALGLGELVEIVWIEHHTLQPGSHTIEAIATCFGNPTMPYYSGVYSGDQVRVFVWEDLNGDGNPSDAALLASATSFVNGASIDTDVLQEIPIGPVMVSESFFIGAAVVSDGYPAPLDQNGIVAHESWIAASSVGGGEEEEEEEDKAQRDFNPNGFYADNLDDIGQSANFLLRAITPVGPAPNDCNGNGIPDDCDLLGDLDGNGSVDYDDYVMFRSAFGGEVDGIPACDYCCDYDGSGAVGLADYNAWLDGYRDFIGDPFAGPPSAPGVLTPILGGQGGLKKKSLPSAGEATQPAAGSSQASGATKKLSR